MLHSDTLNTRLTGSDRPITDSPADEVVKVLQLRSRHRHSATWRLRRQRLERLCQPRGGALYKQYPGKEPRHKNKTSSDDERSKHRFVGDDERSTYRFVGNDELVQDLSGVGHHVDRKCVDACADDARRHRLAVFLQQLTHQALSRQCVVVIEL